jgi:hypothetical protein
MITWLFYLSTLKQDTQPLASSFLFMGRIRTITLTVSVALFDIFTLLKLVLNFIIAFADVSLFYVNIINIQFT